MRDFFASADRPFVLLSGRELLAVLSSSFGLPGSSLAWTCWWRSSGDCGWLVLVVGGKAGRRVIMFYICSFICLFWWKYRMELKRGFFWNHLSLC